MSEQVRHVLTTRGEFRVVRREQLLHLQPCGFENGAGLAGARHDSVGDPLGDVTELSFTLGKHELDLCRRRHKGRTGRRGPLIDGADQTLSETGEIVETRLEDRRQLNLHPIEAA